MNIKSHPDYWNVHKEIWQQEYDNLNSRIAEAVRSEPHSKEAREFNSMVIKEVERKLLSPVK